MSVLRGSCIGVSVLLAFELGARLTGALDPTDRPDPYMGFPGTSTLYRVERDESGALVRRTAPNKQSRYRIESFPVDVPADEFRVFCVGGSSVRSQPLRDPDAAFPALLELYLQALLPGKHVRVINAGGGGTGSIQNLEVVRQVLDYEPDLLIVYPEGGEKNLVPPSPEGVLAVADDESPCRVTARRWLARLRSYQAVRDGYHLLMPPATPDEALRSAFSALALSAISLGFAPEHYARPFELKIEGVPVLMEHPIPPDEIHRAHRRFLSNLKEITTLCRERGVPLLFVQPVRNLMHPFNLRFYVDPSELLPGVADTWRSLWTQARAEAQAGHFEQAVAALRQVRELYVDDHDQSLAYALGRYLAALGRYAEAQGEYARAYALHPVHALIEQAARENDVPLVDPLPALEAISTHGIPGYDEFDDGVHPWPVAHRAIALAIVDGLREGLLAGRLLPADAPELQAAERRVDDIVAQYGPSLRNRMLRAILGGEWEEAVRLGQDAPARRGQPRELVEDVYLVWALVRAGRIDEARALHDELQARYWPSGEPGISLGTDEDIVRVAFSGEVFAWF